MATQPIDDEMAAAIEYQTRENVRSIQDAPQSLLPDGSKARDYLVYLASSGADCYCYWSGGEAYGTCCVWINNTRIAVVDFVAGFDSYREIMTSRESA